MRAASEFWDGKLLGIEVEIANNIDANLKEKYKTGGCALECCVAI